MAATDAKPIPQKNVDYRHSFAIRNSSGGLITSWTGADTEVSKDGAAFADATNEATEIGSSGVGYIDLTAAEMNADSVVVKVTVTNTDAIPYVVTINPEEDGDILANSLVLLESEIGTVNSQTEIVLDSGSDQDDAYNGQAIVLHDDSNNDYPSIRVVDDYVGSTKTLTLDAAPDFTVGTDDSVRIYVTAPGTVAPSTAAIVSAIDSTSNKLANIEADTNELQTDDVPGLIAAIDVSSQIETALEDIKLHKLIANADADDVADNSIIGLLAAKNGDWSSFVANTDSLQGIRDEGDASWNTTAPDPMRLDSTTVDTVTTQSQLILTDGPDFDDAYNGQTIVVYDVSNNDYPSVRVITDWDGTTKTATLDSDPDFTVVAADTVDIFATAPGLTAPTTSEIVTAIDGTSSQLAAIVADTNEIQQDLTSGGRLDTTFNTILADTNEMQSDLTDGGRLDLIFDAVKSSTESLTFTGTNLQVVLHDATSAALAKFASVDTGETASVAGSVVALSQAGLTAIATSIGDLRGGDLDSLETLSDQIDAIDTATLADDIAAMLGGIELTVQQQTAIAGQTSITVNQGKDYTRRPMRITIDTSGWSNPTEDLSSQKLIFAWLEGTTKKGVRMDIEGSPGSHYSDFNPTSAQTELWDTGTFNAHYAIEWGTDEYEEIGEPTTMTVEPFDFEPGDLIDV